ncbi:Bromodomain-containing protein 4B, partial [Mucuna pruriens]
MKRKRVHKKGKAKGTTNHGISGNENLSNDGGQNKEETSGLDEFGNDRDNSGMEVDTPSSTGTDQHCNIANINPDGSIDKAVGKSVGRVKVKLRTPKMLDSQPTSSDAPTQSDTDKSSQQHGLDKQGVNAERMEDSANSLPDMKMGTLSKRTASIKIKSSKVLGSNADQTGKPFSASTEITHPKERKAPQQNPQYNKQELDGSLVVIRKVMKMDAAEPFNVPVNPEALGIPDYFDIIDTPMDFGTICRNLEKSEKYMNSEDVFKDVQYIWDNCYKYNNKGDYILDLMRRVKKNFMKYWTAAGLYSEPSKGTKGERTSAEDIALSGEGKVGKSGQLKQKTKKRHGRHHKHDCLCAICVLKRRRKEREENARIARGNFGSGGDMHAKEFKHEESIQVESPGGEDSSSNLDESLGTDGDVDEDKGEVAKMEISEKQCSPSERKHASIDVDNDDDDDDHGPEEGDEEEEENEEEEDEEEIEMNSQKREMDETLKHGGTLAEKSNVSDATVLHDEYRTKQQEGQAAAVQKHKGSQDKQQKGKLLENLCSENPKLSSLCGILFPQNSQSAWSGPHSLIQKRNSARSSSIHAAIRTFMDCS